MPKPLTQEQYIEKAIQIHNNFYSYSKTVYTKAHDKVIITCPVHGDFTMKACNHTNQKQGCPTCADNKVWDIKRFIETANKIHNNFYSYNKAVYINSHKKLTITCPKHGDFEQQPYVHLQNHGCPECAKDKISATNSKNLDIWSYRGWEEAGNLSKEFEGFSLYVIQCYDKNIL
jgi:ferredoxin-like protein FixX